MTPASSLSLSLVLLLVGADADLICRFKGQAAEVADVALSPDGGQAASASRNGVVRVWDTETGREIHQFNAGQAQSQRVRFSPDGRQVASVTGDGSVVLWQTDTGREIRRFSLKGRVQAVAFCAEGDRFQLLSGAKGGSFQLWDLATGQPIRSFEQPIDSVSSLDLSEDGGRALAAGDQRDGVSPVTAVQRLWETTSGSVIVQRALGHRPELKAFLSPDGQLILSETPLKPDRLVLLDEKCSLIWSFPWPEAKLEFAVFSPDGRYALAVSEAGSPYLLDTRSGRSRIILSDGQEGVASAAFSSDGARILVGRQNSVELRRVPRFPDLQGAPGQELHLLPHDAFVYSGAFSPDGRQVLTSSLDGTMRLWDVEYGRELKKWQAEKDWDTVDDLAWASDGRHALLASTGYRGVTKVTLWDVEAWKPVWTRHGTGATSVAFRPRDQRPLYGAWDGRLCYYRDLEGTIADQFEEPSGRPFRRVAFSPNGRRAVCTAGSEETVVGVWNLEEGDEYGTVTLLPHEHVRQAIFFPDDNNRVLSGGWDRTLRIWDMAGREPVQIIRTPEPITAIAILPDNRRAVTAGANGRIRLWDLAKGAQVHELGGHEGEVTAIDVSPDGRYALSTSYDFTARLWKLPPGEPEGTPNGKTLHMQHGMPKCDVELLAGSSPAHVHVRDVNVRIAIRQRERKAVVADTISGEEVRWDMQTMELVVGENGLTVRPAGDRFTLARRQKVIAEVRSRPQPERRPDSRQAGERPAAQMKQIRLFKANDERPGTVGDVDFSPDADLLVSAHWSGYVRLWEVETGRQVRRFDGHREIIKRSPNTAGVMAKVNAARFSPDGTLVASGGDDRKVLVWKVDNGEVVCEFRHGGIVDDVVFSSKGDRVLTAEKSGPVRLWDVAKGKTLSAKESSLDSISALGLSPNGELAVAAGIHREGAKPHGVLRVWDLATEKTVFELDYPEGQTPSVASFVDNGKSVLSEVPLDPYSLAIWDLESGKETTSRLAQHARIYSIAFSSDGDRLLVGLSSSMQLFELGSRRHLATCSYTGPFRCVAFSLDGRYVASGNNWQVLLWSRP